MPNPTFQRALRKAEKHLAAADADLAKVIARVGRCEIEPAPFEPFHALVRSICHQQLHGKAAETIHQRVKDAFGDGHEPSLQKIHKARLPSLRKCGLSESKALAIKDLAKKTLEGVVPTAAQLEGMSDDEIVARVTEVRGIGRWTVEMMLMFRMGRLDVFPVDDFGVRKGYSMLKKHREQVKPKQLLPLGDAWRPYRTVASWYLWRVADGR